MLKAGEMYSYLQIIEKGNGNEEGSMPEEIALL